MRNDQFDDGDGGWAPAWLPTATPEPAPEECWDLCQHCGSHDVSVFHGRAVCEDCGSNGPFLFSAGLRRGSRAVAMA